MGTQFTYSDVSDDAATPNGDDFREDEEEKTIFSHFPVMRVTVAGSYFNCVSFIIDEIESYGALWIVCRISARSQRKRVDFWMAMWSRGQ